MTTQPRNSRSPQSKRAPSGNCTARKWFERMPGWSCWRAQPRRPIPRQKGKPNITTSAKFRAPFQPICARHSTKAMPEIPNSMPPVDDRLPQNLKISIGSFARRSGK